MFFTLEVLLVTVTLVVTKSRHSDGHSLTSTIKSGIHKEYIEATL